MSESEIIVLNLVLVFTTCLFVMIVLFFVLINKYRKNLEKRQREALNNLLIGQDNERQRLARDLHDEMGPELSNIIFTLDAIKSTDPEIKSTIDQSKNEIKSAIKGLRNLSHDLMSQSLIKYGIADAIQEMIDRQQDRSKKIYFDTNCTGTVFPDIVKSNLFRISQELFYNTIKHSQADEVIINLNHEKSSSELLFEYSDNGIGIQADKQNEGIGLKNIKTRVNLIHGRISFPPEKGYKVIITIRL